MPWKFRKASKQGDIKDALDISEYLTDLLMGDLFQLASESPRTPQPGLLPCHWPLKTVHV